MTVLPLHRQPHGIPAAQAERRNALMHVAPDHLVQQRGEDARSGGADRMSERNRAAVHIDLAEVESQLPGDGNGSNRERFIDLVQVDVVVLPTCFLPELANGFYRSHHHPGRIEPAGGLRYDSGHRFQFSSPAIRREQSGL